MTRIASVAKRYGRLVQIATWVALVLLTPLLTTAQSLPRPSGDFLTRLKEQLSPENVLHYRETHPRIPLSRQPPPGLNSWNVELVGMTGGGVYDVAVQGSYAYCANGVGLVVLDVSVPGSPRWAGGLMLLEGGWRVAAAPPYVYLGDISGGFYVIDVSTPQQPRVVGYCDTGNRDRGIQKIALSGSYAYLACLSRRLQVLDISDRRNPRLVSSLSFSSYVYDVFIAGSLAYVAVWGEGLQVVDISNPLAPQKAGAYIPKMTDFNAKAVSVSGTRAYLAGANGVVVLDVSDPQQPRQIAAAAVPGTGKQLSIAAGRVYVANGAKGVRIIDASDLNNIRETASFAEEQNDAWSVYPVGNHAYVANGYLGLLILDVSSPAVPRIAGRYFMPGSAMGVAVSGSYVYVGGLVAGVQVVDVANPALPREVGRRKLVDWVWNIATSAPYVYAASWEHGLQVVDVSDPLNPRVVGSNDTPKSAVGIAVAGHRAYVADGYEGLHLFDIGNPTAPVRLGSVDTPDQAFDVFVSDTTAYVADVNGGLRIIDVSDPRAPREIGAYNHHAKGVYVSGSYAYVAGGQGGLRIVDVSDPAHPREVGSYSTTGDVWSVAVAGTLAFVAEEDGGLAVIDVTDPFNPILVGYHDTPRLALRVAVDGNYAYLANLDSGVLVFRYTGSVSNHPPRTPTLLAPEHNQNISDTTTPTFRLITEDIDGDRVKFEIQLTRGDDTRSFSTGFVASGEEATVTVPVEQALTAGTWSWRARAVDERGAVSNWSATQAFTMNVNTPPSVPTLIAPASGTIVSATPSLTLKASDPDGERVKLEIQVTDGTDVRTFTTDYVDSGAEVVYTVPADQPLSERQWNWKAKAIDERGAESAWSEAWSFTVATNRAPAVPTLIAPAPNAVITPTPTFRLRTDDPNGERVKFVIRLSRGTEARSFVTEFVSSGADATYTVPSAQPLSQGPWSWRAKAIDEQGVESGWSEAREFTVRIDKCDLSPVEVNVSSPKAMAGGKVTISVRITNRGDAPSSASRTRVQISRSANAPSTSDRALTEFLTPTLGVNQSITHESEVIIPADMQPGDYTVWVIVDANGVLDQSDRSNDQNKVALRVVLGAQVWLPAGVNTFGVSTSTEQLAPASIGLSGMAMKRWEPGAGYLDVSEAQPLQMGKAYWVRTPRSMAVRVPAETSAEAAVIHLQRGWNLISCPYPSTVQWSLDLIRVRLGALTVTLEQAQQSGWMESYAWGWRQNAQNPYTGHYVFIYDSNVVPGVQGYLEPWKGYWVYAHKECDLLLPGASDGTRSTGRSPITGKGWSLPVLARRGDSEAEAIIGVSANGRGVGVAPPPAPPATAEGQPVEVFVERAGSPLAVDIRSGLGGRQEWDLVVRFGKAREEIGLHWDGANRLPREVSLTLIDRTTGARRYLRTTPAYRFMPAEGETERRFTLVAERDIGLPLRIAALQATPTRGGSIAVHFTLSRMAMVQVEVLSASGTRVALLDAGGTRQAGTHTLVWRGVDGQGRALPAGVYLVRVRAQDEEGRHTQAVTPLVLAR
ncbi:MAG: hypothetical protein KatS3mg022_1480 [Armatimonadota bacterium]|nr:MAG: hypothetical protein KatS3mg022_1480 [Armatimonadota bacterium]